jgi:allophanate hydrolase
VSVFARSVDEAQSAVVLAAGPDADDPWSRDEPQALLPDRPLRFAVPDPDALVVDGAEANRSRFGAAADTLVAATGGRPSPVDIAVLLAAGHLLYDGAFVAERYAAVGAFVDAHPDDVDPVVRRIITDAGRLPAWRLAADLSTLAGYRRATAALFADVDVLVVPSVPRIPTVAEVASDPIGVNSMLGTYTNFVNLLDLCAVTLPVPTALDDPALPPTSLTLVAPAWHDDVLVAAARSFELTPGGRASLPTP